MSEPIKRQVEEWLKTVSYEDDPSYIPSEFALEFINFIKMVNGGEGEEHASPVVHFRMLDQVAGMKQDIANLCSRGMAKTSLFGEYLFLYLGVYGSIPGFGKINLALYVSDSIENGVKNMRKNLEYRWENSDFLQEYIPDTRFTDVRWEFRNKYGNVFIVKGYGSKTGVRGAKEMGQRPGLAVLDDMISDDDARSPTVIQAVEDVVYKAVDYALHPTKRKTIWSGTPFNARDPLYKAVESGAWYVNVFPVCEKFPCSKDEFRSAWPDRFGYKYVMTQYTKAKKAGKIDTFNQELMLRIMSDEERLIRDSDIGWYKHRNVTNNKGAFNFYITTDFATSEKESADWSVLNCWALNNNGDWFWVDGYCKKMLMNKSIDYLFLLAQKWGPQSVGIEITGQQGGFIQWIQSEMQVRNNYFTLASAIGSNKPGLRPTKDKMSRFQTNAVPLFKAGKIFFPEELKDSEELREVLDELRLATVKGFKSRHDDCHPFRTLVDTPLGQVPIGVLRDGDRVFTYKNDHRLTGVVESFRMTGIKRILKITLENESVVECSEYHPVLTSEGYIVAKDLTENSKLIRSKICKSSMILLNGQRKLQDITSQRRDVLMEVERTGSINTSTKKKLAEYLKDLKYTISTKIRIITNQVILRYLRMVNIGLYTKVSSQSICSQETMNSKILHRQQREESTKVSRREESEPGRCQEHACNVRRSLLSTIKQKTGQSSVVMSVLVNIIKWSMSKLSFAVNAESPFYRLGKGKKFVATLVREVQQELHRQELLRASASSVDEHSLLVGELLRAEKNAIEYEKIVRTENIQLVRVRRIEAGEIEPTFNFEIRGTHNYSVENGYIVHNCIDTITMLGEIETWRPSEVSMVEDKENNAPGYGRFIWDQDDSDEDGGSSYFV